MRPILIAGAWQDASRIRDCDIDPQPTVNSRSPQATFEKISK